MRILCLGDVVGRPGRTAVRESFKALKKKYAFDFCVVNGENAAGGSGISSRIAKSFFHLGIDAITLGDHAWDQSEVYAYLDKDYSIVRPANFPEDTPGKGFKIIQAESGIKIAVINMLGRTFMKYMVDCPFRKMEAILKELPKSVKVIIVDMHAETTSEKIAMGHFLTKKVSIVFGTHTHVQTADETILNKHTAYITDLGMTGPYDSVIGQEKKEILERFYRMMPVRFKVAENDVKICGILVDVDEKTGVSRSIERIQESFTAK